MSSGIKESSNKIKEISNDIIAMHFILHVYRNNIGVAKGTIYCTSKFSFKSLCLFEIDLKTSNDEPRRFYKKICQVFLIFKFNM